MNVVMYRSFSSNLSGWLALMACVYVLGSTVAHSQDANQPSAADADESGSTDSSREVDINEDNYRRYMELKDPRLERPAFPAANIQPNAGLEKMAQLPEESQKHLRNELRSIISTSGPWTPEERQRAYRFKPTDAARKDGQLLRKEAEAWAELVGQYHNREEAIMAGRMQNQSPTPGQDGNRQPSPSGQPGDANNQSQQTAQMNAQNAAMQAASNSGAAATDSQNEGQNEQAQSQQGGQSGSGEQNGEQGSQGSNSRQAGANQDSEYERRRVPLPPESNGSRQTETAPRNEGVSQSALDFLAAQGKVPKPEPRIDGTGVDGAIELPSLSSPNSAPRAETLEGDDDPIPYPGGPPLEQAPPAPSGPVIPDGAISVEALRNASGLELESTRPASSSDEDDANNEIAEEEAPEPDDG